MAINSISERFTAANFGTVTLVFLPKPDSTFTAVDRLHLLGLYSGIPAAQPTENITEYVLATDAFSRGLTLTRTIESADIGFAGAATFTLEGKGKICTFSVRLDGGDAKDYTAFTLEAQINADGPWSEIVTAWGVAGSENGLVLHSRNVLETLAWDTSGMAILDVSGLYAIRFKAKIGSIPTEGISETLEIDVTR